MQENVGNLERSLRAVAGPMLVRWGYRRLKKPRRRLLGVVAIVGGAMVAETAMTRVCPINAALGIDRSGRHRDATTGRDTYEDDMADSMSVAASEVQAAQPLPFVG